MTEDQARAEIEKWSMYKQFPMATIDNAIERYYEAKGLLRGIEIERQRIKEAFFPSNHPELNINRPIAGDILWKVLHDRSGQMDEPK